MPSQSGIDFHGHLGEGKQKIRNIGLNKAKRRWFKVENKYEFMIDKSRRLNTKIQEGCAAFKDEELMNSINQEQ